MDRPKPIEGDIDLTAVRELCEEHFDMIARDREDNTDMDNYIYEAVLEALYGKDVFVWVNENLD